MREGGEGREVFHPEGVKNSERMIENNVLFLVPLPYLFLKLITHRVSVQGPCISFINQYPMLETHPKTLELKWCPQRQGTGDSSE